MNFCAFYTTILARRSTARNGTTQNDTFGYNARSELTSATLGSDNYAYAFDNIGNRNSATETGTWQITYNGANRPVRFRNEESDTTIDCGYDSQGRRYFKKVTVSGTVTLHHRYIYRGYFQIAAVDMTRSGQPDLWLTTWDPSQATATRPLAIQKDGTWFTYGYDLTKNICEVFGPAGYIRTAYSYAPFGAVTASGDVTQPFQWSSEVYDSELDLVYYNYRHYSPSLGRFLSRDPIQEQGGWNLYAFVGNSGLDKFDVLGRKVYWASRDLDSFFIGNHHFILIAFFNGEPLPQGVASHEIKCEKNKCKKRHRIVTLSLARNSNGYISLSDSLESDRKAYKEEYCDESKFRPDFDYQASEVRSPFGSEKDFVKTIVRLYNNSKVNFLKRPVQYSLANKNCASWVNTLFFFCFYIFSL